MFGDHGREQKIIQNDHRVREVEIRLEGQNREIEQFFADCDLSPEQIRLFLENPDYFTSRNWEQLSELKEHESDRLEHLSQPTIDPKKSREFREKFTPAAPSWIPVS